MRGRSIRSFTLAMFFAVGCSQPNPEACCTTADQCLMFGLGGVTNCDSTHVCNVDGNCVVPMCKVDADCNDASMVCDMNGACVPAPGPTDCTEPGHACATGVCDTTSKMCVECIDDSTCSGATPICHSDTCEPCALNADCPESNTCLPTGACAASTDVAYVRANGGGTTCTQNAPCRTLLQGLSLPRPYVRLAGAVTESVTLSNDTTKTIIGERDSTGKTITSTISNTTANSTLVTVSGMTTSLTLVDIALAGTANNNDGVQLQATANTVKVSLLRCSVNGVAGYGIEASYGEVDVDRSSITSNLLGGLNLSTSIYHVKNTFIVGNGSGAARASAASISHWEPGRSSSRRSSTTSGCPMRRRASPAATARA